MNRNGIRLACILVASSSFQQPAAAQETLTIGGKNVVIDADGLHPTPEGAEILGRAIARFLAELAAEGRP